MAERKLLAVVGPTSSGKSDLAVRLAKKFGGEIISADSRQVYTGMNLGTGKITKKEMGGIPHYLLDVASPKKKFTVVQYRKRALPAINKILKRGRIPFVVGGTGFYIQALIDGIVIPAVPPDWKLRKELEKQSTGNLCALLSKLDPARAKNIERKNKRRLIRAIEIIKKSGKPVPAAQKNPLDLDVLIIGIKKPNAELKKRIKKRLLMRLKQGMIAEVKRLHAKDISWKRLEELGLEYRFVAQYLQGKIDRGQMIKTLQTKIEDYARRQMTWFKRDPRICWIESYKKAEKLTENFLGNK